MKTLTSFLFLVLFALSSCKFSAVQGDGKIVTESRALDLFQDLSASGAFDIELIYSDSYSVEIEMDENLLEFIEIEVKSKELRISSSKNIESSQKTGIKIYAPFLNKIQITGACKLLNKQKFRTEKLHVDLSGASKLDLYFDTKYVMINNSGASKTTLRGNADEVRIDLSGASYLEASEMRINDLILNATGASKVRVWADNKLNIMASGASQILYKGEPAKLKTEVTGAASVSSF